MGAAIAAHLGNAGLRVRLLDIVPKDAPPPGGDRRARNKVALAGLEAARKSKPASFFSPRFETLVTAGNLEDDLEEAAAKSDVIIEAIIENLAIKQKLVRAAGRLRGARRHHVEHLRPAHRRADAGAQRRASARGFASRTSSTRPAI